MANFLPRALTEHPESVGESYGEHCGVAFSFAWRMIAAGLACMVHAVLPFLFVGTGNQMIARLHDRMLVNRKAISRRENASAQPISS